MPLRTGKMILQSEFNLACTTGLCVPTRMTNSTPLILAKKKQAYSFFQNNQLSEAKTLLAELCKTDRRDADVWNLLAAVHGRLQEYVEAERCARRVVELQPKSNGAYNNLANALKFQGKFEQAEVSYRRALQLHPNYAEAHNNLAGLMRAQGKIEDAQTHYVRALQLKPSYLDASFNLGTLLLQQNKIDEAQVYFQRTMLIKPDHVDAILHLGSIYLRKEMRNDAETLFRRALQINPESENARYLLAILGAHEMPTQTPSGYVKQLFDAYAESFDLHLTKGLSYHTPEKLFNAVSSNLRNKQEKLDILDLGCGTGLCGPLFRDAARHLVGVDLSPGMLDKARKRNVYDDLLLGDVTQALSIAPVAYDLIISTDVFIYIGDLQRIFESVHAALRPGGLFAFSTENAENVDKYELRGSGRYAHAAEYITSLGREAVLDEVSVEIVELRYEYGKPMMGSIYILRKP